MSNVNKTFMSAPTLRRPKGERWKIIEDRGNIWLVERMRDGYRRFTTTRVLNDKSS